VEKPGGGVERTARGGHKRWRAETVARVKFAEMTRAFRRSVKRRVRGFDTSEVMSTQILFGLLITVVSGGFLLALGAKFMTEAEGRRHGRWLKDSSASVVAGKTSGRRDIRRSDA
jgi:hypothetical protein